MKSKKKKKKLKANYRVKMTYKIYFCYAFSPFCIFFVK